MKILFPLIYFWLLLLGPLLADEKPKRLTIATWNLEWFYDSYTGDNLSKLAKQRSAPSRSEWNWKLESVAAVIGQMQPTILALQEVENRRVVSLLTQKLAEDHGLKYRIAFIEGRDRFTEQDVAVIYQSGLVQYSRCEQTTEMFNSQNFYNVNKHLFAKFEWGKPRDKQSLTMLNVHLRASADKHDLRKKQCKLIRHWLQDKIENGESVVVLGDFNTEQTNQSIDSNSDLAIISGWETSTKADDLFDVYRFVAPQAQATHLSGKQFDRILVSKPLLENQPRSKDLVFSRIATFESLVVSGTADRQHFDSFYQIPRAERDVSDHYPVMAEFEFK